MIHKFSKKKTFSHIHYCFITFVSNSFLSLIYLYPSYVLFFIHRVKQDNLIAQFYEIYPFRMSNYGKAIMGSFPIEQQNYDKPKKKSSTILSQPAITCSELTTETL